MKSQDELQKLLHQKEALVFWWWVIHDRVVNGDNSFIKNMVLEGLVFMLQSLENSSKRIPFENVDAKM